MPRPNSSPIAVLTPVWPCVAIGEMAAVATFIGHRAGGSPSEAELQAHVGALLACRPDVTVVVGSQSSHARVDWAVHAAPRLGGALDGGPVSGVILPTLPDLADEVLDALWEDGLPACALHGAPHTVAARLLGCLALRRYSGAVMLLEPPRTRPAQARAAGATLALVMAARGVSWGLLGYGDDRQLETQRDVAAGARSVERALGALGA